MRAAAPERGPPERGPRTAREFPLYTPSERRADAIVHATGLILGLGACVALAVTALPRGNPPRLIGLGVYATGLMAMLGCSALYNLTAEGDRKRLFRRLDHAAIFLMIAGTYTPLAPAALGGARGWALLAFVWTVATGGMTVELLGLRRPDGLLIAAYLLLGWSVLVTLGPLSAALPPSGVALLVAGGVLYSLGVVFHLWTRLPYANAIWHGFVLAAAACHYAAILRTVTS